MYFCIVDIIQHISTSANLRKAAKNITKGNDLWKDLLQEVIIIVLLKTKEDLKKIENIDYFCIGLMLNQYNSTTSPFFKKYRHINDEVIDIDLLRNIPDNEEQEYELMHTIIADEIKVEKIKEVVEELRPIQRILHKMYYEMPKKSFRKLSKQVDIPPMSICLEVKKANEKIKECIKY